MVADNVLSASLTGRLTKRTVAKQKNSSSKTQQATQRRRLPRICRRQHQMAMTSSTSELPKTDEDAIELLSEKYYSSLVAQCLQGIYRCRRGQGESVLRAYEITLRAYIEPYVTHEIQKEE